MPTGAETLRVATAVTVGAIFLLGFAYYRYSSVSRKKKREDDKVDSELSVEVKKVVPLANSIAPSSTNNVSVSITTKENGEVLNEMDKKEEARRVIQKVLSQEMIKNIVPEKSKKILEDTLEGLSLENNKKPFETTLSRGTSSERLPEISRYVPFEEVLNRKSMERSPTPSGSRLGPSSLPSGASSPSKSYVYISRESSFVKDDTGFSPKKGSRSPSFELFKSKRTSVEKEVTEVVTSNVESVSESLQNLVERSQDVNKTAFKKEEINVDKVIDSMDDLTVKLHSKGVDVPKEAKLLLNSFNQIPMNGTEKSKTDEMESTSSRKSSVEISSVVKPISSFDSYTSEKSSAEVNKDEQVSSLSEGNSSSLGNSLDMNNTLPVSQPVMSLNELESNTQSTSNGTSLTEDFSSIEIIDLKPRLFQEEKEPSPEFQRFVREGSSAEFEKEKIVPKEEVRPELSTTTADEVLINEIPSLETLPTSNDNDHSDMLPATEENSSTQTIEDSKKDDRLSSSTNFRPWWATNSKNNGSNGHVWEKGAADIEKGRPIPNSNQTENDDEMNLLSRSQEKEIHSKAPLLSDSDEEGKVQEEPTVLSQPRMMEGIKEESEEPVEAPSNNAKRQDSKKRRNKGRKK